MFRGAYNFGSVYLMSFFDMHVSGTGVAECRDCIACFLKPIRLNSIPRLHATNHYARICNNKEKHSQQP